MSRWAKLKQDFAVYQSEGGSRRTLVFAISGIITLAVLLVCFVIGALTGNDPKFVVGILGVVVAILALFPTYLAIPAKAGPVNPLKKSCFAWLEEMSNAIVILTLATLSLVLAVLSFM